MVFLYYTPDHNRVHIKKIYSSTYKNFDTLAPERKPKCIHSGAGVLCMWLFVDVGHYGIAPYEVSRPEQVQSVVGEVGTQISVGIAHQWIEVDERGSLALGYGG